MKFSNFTVYRQVFYLVALFCFSCKKEDDFLAAKPDQKLFVPGTLTDLVNMMHDERIYNNNDPALGLIASDDFYVQSSDLSSLSTTEEKKGYLWAKQVYDAGENVPAWTLPYQQVYNCNVVLETLPKVPVAAGQQGLAAEIKGDALFFRGRAFYNLLQTFAIPYDPKTAANDPGIPLRLASDLNIRSVRASIRAGYDQVLQDLKASVDLLPVQTAYKTQPSRAAAEGFLSRVYLALGDFQQSLIHAESALHSVSTLTDYNSLKPTSFKLTRVYLDEDIFHSVLYSYQMTSTNTVSVTDSALYLSYQPNDLRKSKYFILNNGRPYFRGTYDFKSGTYNGIATDELYLNKAECEARLGNTAAAMSDLNTLLSTRWLTGTFAPYQAASPEDALQQVLTERRKELLYRGLRWTDLRRLNKDPGFAVTLQRSVAGVTYTLPPNDPRYAWPIPENEITLSGIPQNPR
jgi:tetratricopeptide (TPR) repeat protein